MGISKTQLKNTISRVLRPIPEFYSENAITQLLMTAAVETDFGHNKFYQIGGGPARGIMGVEFMTMIDNYENHLAFPKYAHQRRIIGEITGVITPTIDDLERNDWFNILMARVKYYRSPKAIPKTIEGMAKFHEEWYNARPDNYAVTGKYDWQVTLEKYRKYCQ